MAADKSSIINAMTDFQHLAGVYAAALTPLRNNFSPSLDEIPNLLDFLARRGCHGALILGTTGEGPSFSPGERRELIRASLRVRQVHPHFHLLAGTGTPSLEETVELNRVAFDLGIDGVVVLPPYYFRKVDDDGLFAWFEEVIRRSVPAGAPLFGYHIPSVSGVPLSLDLLERLKESFPDRFAGIKDSSADAEHARRLGERFGKNLLVMSGNDPLFSLALKNSASGCITALANLLSPDLRRIWDAHQRNEVDDPAHAHLLNGRAIVDRYPPAPPLLKYLLSRLHAFKRWPVRPPLQPLSQEMEGKVWAEAQSLINGAGQTSTGTDVQGQDGVLKDSLTG
jgi:4-hydroxy-tetrahydrodipicolinate synthase